MPVFLLSEKIEFPKPCFARKDGLLAVGGDLTTKRLLLAYKMGIFPWYSENEPVIWWSPDPRLVLFPKNFRISRSLKKTINQNKFQITMDTAFEEVIVSCAHAKRKQDPGTWIVDDMIDAYCRLFESGFAHSVEAWHDGKLAGGLYGVSLGKCFFGESMFSNKSNSSKVAFAAFVKYLDAMAFDMIDCQIKSDHLLSFGAQEISRDIFLKFLKESLSKPSNINKWHFESR